MTRRKPMKKTPPRGGTIVRATIPEAWENLIQAVLPAEITIPPKNYIYALDDLLYVEGEIKFSPQDAGTPIVLFLKDQTEVRIAISRRFSREGVTDMFNRAASLSECVNTLKQAYARGVPHFGEIEDKLKALLVVDSKTELGHRLYLREDDAGWYFVAKGLCRDVYYEVAMFDGTLHYRVEYIGPDQEEGFTLTADQLWEALIQNTMWDVPHLFKAPRQDKPHLTSAEQADDDEDDEKDYGDDEDDED